MVRERGKKWVAENIISEEQYRLIVAKYKDNHSQRGIGLIPIFASILIGLESCPLLRPIERHNSSFQADIADRRFMYQLWAGPYISSKR